jgi:hypothetical protein
VNIGKDEIVIRLISTQSIPESKVAEVRKDLMRRTGREVQLSVDAVASSSELAELIQHLTHPPGVLPKEKTIAETQKELFNKVDPIIKEIWPLDAPIQDFDVVTDKAGVAIDVQYHATTDLGDAQINTVLQSLRSKLGIQGLTLKAERVRP